ncbi:MAG TPA: hypothetical protein VFH28_05400 [Nitrososphaera sp.]|nr:hypothetical protein [Nitrososphaera sp.]
MCTRYFTLFIKSSHGNVINKDVSSTYKITSEPILLLLLFEEGTDSARTSKTRGGKKMRGVLAKIVVAALEAQGLVLEEERK